MFAELLHRYQGHVDKLLYHLAPDWFDRADLAQEVWIRVYRNMRRLNDPAKFKGWLGRITTNLFYDELRRRKRNRATLSLDAPLALDDGTIDWDVAAPAPGPVDAMMTREFYDQLHRARVDALSRPQALLENLGRLAQNGLTLLAMAVWHWTSLVILLAFAGLSAIPPAYYQAAALDGASRWQVFRHVELPHLRSVLMIAVLLRLMDSLMIYTEPLVLTGGGPGNTTTFLSQYLATIAVGQFDLGPAAAFSILYFLLILLLCWLFHTAVTAGDGGDRS